ncbi:50S ribosomal protein L18 [candidate division KSB1 bacterium]|nr:50S ribosomal protein L18 [candidate division KSB1 bacterium]
MKDRNKEKRLKRFRKKLHLKKTISGTAEKPRLVVFRSLKNIYVQLVDDASQHTLAATSSLSQDVKAEIQQAESGKTKVAFIVGKEIARKAKEAKISKVIFDRGGYLYHGRVKALADGAREGGLEF